MLIHAGELVISILIGWNTSLNIYSLSGFLHNYRMIRDIDNLHIQKLFYIYTKLLHNIVFTVSLKNIVTQNFGKT